MKNLKRNAIKNYIHVSFMYVKSLIINAAINTLIANLSVSQVQQWTQLFGVKMHLDFLIA